MLSNDNADVYYLLALAKQMRVNKEPMNMQEDKVETTQADDFCILTKKNLKINDKIYTTIVVRGLAK